MAKATLNPEVTKTKTVVVTPETITLELSNEEATILRTILGKFVSGGPTTPVWSALAGLVPLDDEATVRAETSWGDTILFYEKKP